MTSQSKEEDEWRAFDRLDQGLPAADEEEAKLRAPYEKLIEQILEEGAPRDVPAGWRNDFDACWEAEQRRKRRRGLGLGLGAGVGVAAAAMAAMLLMRRIGDVPALEVAFASQERNRGDRGALGDTMTVRARGGRTVTLLIYREQELLATCPGSVGCRSEGGREVFELRLAKAGTYRLVRAQGSSEKFTPGAGGYNSDRLDAEDRGVDWQFTEQRVSP